MDKPCTPIPCPDFETATLHVTAVCDCPWEFNGLPGSVDCPVHGERVRGYIEGWNAAADAFERAARQTGRL